MKYFLDTEFIEGVQPKKFLGIKYGETKPVVDLISIGIVCEDGREYYAVNRDFNLNHAWDDEWIRNNVLMKFYTSSVHGDARNDIPFDKSFVRHYLKTSGKSKDVIATDILEMVIEPAYPSIAKLSKSLRYPSTKRVMLDDIGLHDPAEFWAYYASTDWVAFYQLWGKMLEQPVAYPMYVKDLKNLMDFYGLDKKWKDVNCPDPVDEHNALADARWNMDLYNKIKEYVG